MNKWIAIGGGIVAAVAALGTGAYFLYKHYESCSQDEKEEEEAGNNNKSYSELEHPDLLVVMDEALVESVDFLMKYYEMISKQPSAKRKEMTEEIRSNRKFICFEIVVVQKKLYSFEKEVCGRKNWSVEQYYEEIDKREKAKDK